MPFQTIRHIPNRFLALYSRELEKQRHLLERIRRLLPNALAAHVICCVADEQRLVLYTDAAVWASQLRFYQQDILALLVDKQHGGVPMFRIKVRPNVSDYKDGANPGPRLPSQEKIEIIRHQCDHFADEELKKAVRKLCATMSRKRHGDSY